MAAVAVYAVAVAAVAMAMAVAVAVAVCVVAGVVQRLAARSVHVVVVVVVVVELDSLRRLLLLGQRVHSGSTCTTAAAAGRPAQYVYRQWRWTSRRACARSIQSTIATSHNAATSATARVLAHALGLALLQQLHLAQRPSLQLAQHMARRHDHLVLKLARTSTSTRLLVGTRSI